jgi:hypothetical protein
MAVVGICKLCGVNGELKDSHIIPDFFIRGLEYQTVTGKSGQTQPFSILLTDRPEMEGGAKQRGYWEKILGMTEYLLCGVCEQQFGEYETYVRGLFYGNAPSPLKKVSVGQTIVDFTHQPDFEGLLGAQRVQVDYTKLRLFQLSILWRAGVAKGDFFENVSLGEYHELKLKTLLQNEDPGKETDYACVMMDMRHKGKGCEGWIETPKRSKDGHQVGYRFIIGGYFYLFTVSKQMPRPSARLCSVKPNGEIIVVVGDATRMLRSKATTLHKLGRI